MIDPSRRARKALFAVGFLIALLSAPKQALASGDIECTPLWRMVHHGYGSCSNIAFLSPGNDTRVNLLLMLADMRPATLPPGIQAKTGNSPVFAWEELAGIQSSWKPYDATTPDQERKPCDGTVPPDDNFAAVVRADASLKPAERDALLSARTQVQEGCAPEAMASAVAGVQKAAFSPAARAYAQYLSGAAQFWQDDNAGALAIFQSLATTQSPWVRETAIYLVARSQLRSVQVGAFDEYGARDEKWHPDPARVAAALTALDQYLKQYPNGRYAMSARGLKRRAYWLAGDTQRLSQMYVALLLQAPEQRGISDADLIQEIDNKVVSLPTTADPPSAGPQDSKPQDQTHEPLLLAMLDLASMRTEDPTVLQLRDKPFPYQGVSRAALQQQKQYFTGNVPLYEYLLATYAFYVEGRPAEVLQLIPDAGRVTSFTYLQFSRQVLRGMALETLKQPSTLPFWTKMLPEAKAPFQEPTLELAIAYHHEHAGTVAAVFAPGSPVHYPYLREVLLERVADAALLRQQATNKSVSQSERDVALLTLLYKEATRGHEAAFLKDVALVPPNAPTEKVAVSITSDTSTALGSGAVERVPLGIFLHNRTDPHYSCPALRLTEAQLVQDHNDPGAQLCLADFMRLNAPYKYMPAVTYPDEVGSTPSLLTGDESGGMNTYIAVLGNGRANRNDKAYALYRAVYCYAPTGNSSCSGKDVPKAQRKAWFQELKRDYADTRWASALKYYW